MHGDRLTRVVLYGSRTRSDAHADCNVDAPLREALKSVLPPPPDRPLRGQRARICHDVPPLRFVFDADAVEAPHARRKLAGADVPFSFASHARRYRTRQTITLRLLITDASSHDAVP